MSETDPKLEAKRWLRFADEDLASARDMLREGVGVPRHVCWLAQQSAEKTLKGVLVCLEKTFPRTHDLDLLRSLLPETWFASTPPESFAELSEWAVESRYP